MKKKMLIASLLAIALLVGIVSAAVLTYYGRITATVTVSQAVTLDGNPWPASSITETVSGSAGSLILGDGHYLVNNADKKIMVDLVSTEADEYDAYPEYRLDARVDDDALFWVLNDYIAWEYFEGLSFDYYIVSGPLEWIPQCNLVLRDGDGVAKYYASWHSFRTGINGTIGVRESITYVKDLFYFYELPSWNLLGLWQDTTWTGMDEATTNTLKAEIDGYQFKYFVMQAGDTSTDPNTGAWEQIVWLSKFTIPYRNVIGIALPTLVPYGSVLQLVEFRMLYDFVYNASEGDYTIVTNVVPLGFGP